MQINSPLRWQVARVPQMQQMCQDRVRIQVHRSVHQKVDEVIDALIHWSVREQIQKDLGE